MLDKKVYYWPYKGVWFSYLQGDGTVLNDGVNEVPLSEEDEVAINKSQNELYCKLYPKLCR